MGFCNERANILDDFFQQFVTQIRQHDKKKSTSYHEAGDAFMGIYLGIAPLAATIIPKYDCLGSVTPGYSRMTIQTDFDTFQTIDNNSDVDEYLQNENIILEVDIIVYLMAVVFSGMFSELYYTYEFNKVGFSGYCENIIVRFYVYGILEIKEKEFLSYAEYTLKRIKENWGNVIIIAEELYRAKKLDEAYFNKLSSSLIINRISPLPRAG